MRILLWCMLSSILAAPVWAVDTCDVPSGLTAPAYTRTTAAEDAFLAGVAAFPQSGALGVLGIGMSNMAIEFDALAKWYDRLEQRNPRVVMVSGAKGGHTALQWADWSDAAGSWTHAATQVARAGLTPAQVVVLVVKMTNAYPLEHGAMTEAQVRTIFDIARWRYPNIRVAQVSGITHTYTGDQVRPKERGRAPEPFPHDDAHMLAALAASQTLPVPTLYYDGWIGDAWTCFDLQDDLVHPNAVGAARLIVRQLDAWRADPLWRVLWRD